MRSENLFSKRGTAVLDTPEPGRVSAGNGYAGGSRARRGDGAAVEMPRRRESAYANDFADDYADELDGDGESAGRARRTGGRVGRSGGLAGILPKTLWGRIAAGCGVVVVAGAGIAGWFAVRGFLLHDEHFTVVNSAAIQIAGNSHLTRAQLLSVFGEDVERNVFRIPLAERRAELESLPWVAHATVMRLLPDRVRVAIVERTPVAFVREGGRIGLVDANGVLLDMPGPDADDATAGQSAAHSAEHYSFPVLTGISAADPLSMRAARMRIYMGFVSALDAGGEHLSQKVSEVDLSDPADVKAVIPDSGEILVHFGDEKFLERYRRYEEHLTEWRSQYPRLATVDLRYERQVVLGMKPEAAKPAAAVAAAAAKPGPTASSHPATPTPGPAPASAQTTKAPGAAKVVGGGAVPAAAAAAGKQGAPR